MTRKQRRTVETYSAETIDWRVGYVFVYFASWLMYRHDPSVSGWIVVAVTGVIYVRFARAGSIGELPTPLVHLIVVLAAAGASTSVMAGVARRSSLILTLLVLYLTLAIIPSLNPQVSIRYGKRVWQSPSALRGDDEFDWTSVDLPARERITHHALRLGLSITTRGLAALAICVSAATMIGTLLVPPKSLRVAMHLIDVNLVATILAKLSFWFRTMTDVDLPANVFSPPVLYLRPFQEDGRIVGMENHPLGCLIGSSGYFANAEPVEAHLTKTLQALGPVVTVAPPGSRVVRGAIRLASTAENWRDVVSKAIRQSAHTVIQLGSTTGIRWEVVHAVGSISLDRIVFWLPRPFDEAARRAYEQLRRTIRPWAILPPWEKGCFVIAFQPDGTPQVHQLDHEAKFGSEGRALGAILTRIYELPVRTQTRAIIALTLGTAGLLEVYLWLVPTR